MCSQIYKTNASQVDNQVKPAIYVGAVKKFGVEEEYIIY